MNTITVVDTRIPIQVKLLYPDSKAPKQGNPTDAGYDIFVHRVEDCGTYIKVYSGIACSPQCVDTHLELVPRSSTYKQGLMLYNSIGIIDVEYKGEILAIFNKTSDFKALPEVGSRVAQLIVRRTERADFEVVEELSGGDRNGGIGSTGV